MKCPVCDSTLKNTSIHRVSRNRYLTDNYLYRMVCTNCEVVYSYVMTEEESLKQTIKEKEQ